MAWKPVEQTAAALKSTGISPERQNHLERRKRDRTVVHWPVRFLGKGAAGAVDNVTQNLSSEGFFFRSNAVFAPGEAGVCILEVPGHDPKQLHPVLYLECRVRVVRVDAPGEDGLSGIGCRIEDYRFLPSVSQRYT